MFFSLLPSIQYSKDKIKYRFSEQDFVTTKNIFRTLSVNNSIYATDVFAEFTILDGVRPDQISSVIYGDPRYDWVLLLTNRIKNYYQDWPLTQQEFEAYLEQKYENPQDIHHWETVEIKNSLGEIVQPAGIEVYYNPDETTQLFVSTRDSGNFIPNLNVKTRDANLPISNTIITRTGSFVTLGSNSPTNYKLTYAKSYSPLVYETIFAKDGLTSVSNYEYEEAINNKKRVIQILKPDYLRTFVDLFKAAVGYLPNEDLVSATTKKTYR